MARPRVFISSTYFDLKYVRASLDIFVQSLGYEAVLSEKGDIAYTPDRPLDISCYREAENSDIFVLIVGGRYGSEASEGKKGKHASFFDRYESITRKEYESAVRRDIPIYIFVEHGVYAEYLTYQRNKDNTGINYAHVDSVNIFRLLEDILLKPRNNQLKTFEKYSEIENWLRDQWAGLFREMLNRQSQQQQLLELTTQVGQLAEVNETLKNYLEAVVNKTVDDPAALISSEEKRLQEAKLLEAVRSNRWFDHVNGMTKIDISDFISLMKGSNSYSEFGAAIQSKFPMPGLSKELESTLDDSEMARDDFDEVRLALGLDPLDRDKDAMLRRMRRNLKNRKQKRNDEVSKSSE